MRADKHGKELIEPSEPEDNVGDDRQAFTPRDAAEIASFKPKTSQGRPLGAKIANTPAHADTRTTLVSDARHH